MECQNSIDTLLYEEETVNSIYVITLFDVPNLFRRSAGDDLVSDDIEDIEGIDFMKIAKIDVIKIISFTNSGHEVKRFSVLSYRIISFKYFLFR